MLKQLVLVFNGLQDFWMAMPDADRHNACKCLHKNYAVRQSEGISEGVGLPMSLLLKTLGVLGRLLSASSRTMQLQLVAQSKQALLGLNYSNGGLKVAHIQEASPSLIV